MCMPGEGSAHVTRLPATRNHDITIAFPFRHKLHQISRCRYKCNLLKNFLTYWETGEENQKINENILAP